MLVVGGNVDFAAAGTPAVAYSSLLDFGQAPLAWQREAMPTGRVMPDAVLLPDGTVAVFNGGAPVTVLTGCFVLLPLASGMDCTAMAAES